MAYEKRDGSGALFKNDRKREGKNDPDYKGDILIGGQEYWLSAWLKDGQRGKFMSISCQPKQAQTYTDAAQPVNPKAREPEPDDLDLDSVPF